MLIKRDPKKTKILDKNYTRSVTHEKYVFCFNLYNRRIFFLDSSILLRQLFRKIIIPNDRYVSTFMSPFVK